MCNDDNARFDPLSLDISPFVLKHEPDFDAFSVMDAEQPALDSAVDPTTLAVISQMIIDVVRYEPQSQSLICSRFKGDGIYSTNSTSHSAMAYDDHLHVHSMQLSFSLTQMTNRQSRKCSKGKAVHMGSS